MHIHTYVYEVCVYVFTDAGTYCGSYVYVQVNRRSILASCRLLLIDYRVCVYIYIYVLLYRERCVYVYIYIYIYIRVYIHIYIYIEREREREISTLKAIPRLWEGRVMFCCGLPVVLHLFQNNRQNFARISPEVTGSHQHFIIISPEVHQMLIESEHLKKGDTHNSAFPHPRYLCKLSCL